MGRNCPRCNAETNTYTNDTEGGTVTFERCSQCPHSTYIDTTAEGSRARVNVDMELGIQTQKQWEESNE